jgi:oxygen-independent coproporphyrinogen-3 oxidase
MQDALESASQPGGLRALRDVRFRETGFARATTSTYWTFGDYLGIGAGAHAKITFLERIRREMRIRQPQAYMNARYRASPCASRTRSTSRAAFRVHAERAALARGVSRFALPGAHRAADHHDRAQLAEAERLGLLERDHQVDSPSAKGRRFLNNLLERFLPDAVAAKPVIPIVNTYSRDTRRP